MRLPGERLQTWADKQTFLVAAVTTGAIFGLTLWLIFGAIRQADWSADGLVAAVLLGVLVWGPLVTASRRRNRG